MKNLYTILIFLFILLLIAIIIEYRRNKLQKMLNNQPTIEEHFITNNKINFSITGVKLLSAEDSSNKIKKKVLHIEGNKLDDIKAVYFGNFNGIIAERSDTELYILPPEYRVFESQFYNYDELEIKFLISNMEILDNPILISKTKENSKTFKLEFDDNNQSLKQGEYNAKLFLELKLRNNSEFNDELIGKIMDNNNKRKLEFNLGKLSNSEITKVEKYISIYVNDSKKISLTLSLENINSCAPSDLGTPACSDIYNPILAEIDCDISNTPVCSNDFIDEEVIIKDVELKYTFDDVNSLFPTGMFYKVDSIEELVNNSEAWNIYLDSGVDKDRKFQNTEIRAFYDSIKKLLGKGELLDTEIQNNSTPVEEEKNFNPTDLNLNIDFENSSKMILTWNKPSKSINKNIEYIFSLVPQNKKLKFKIINQPIKFDVEEYHFFNDDMIPLENYDLNLKVYSKLNNTVLGEIDLKDYKYLPKDIELYHSHLIDDNGNFQYEKIQSNPELVQTYLELTTFNKMKTQDDLMATKENIDTNATCIENNIKNVQKKSTMDSLENEFNDLMYKEQVNEDKIFNKKQKEQQEDLNRISTKIAKLESLQGKLSQSQDVKIKNLKSYNDGTNLSLINLDESTRMVKLNQGCLSNSNNNIAYIPCNALDKGQYFNINKINNVDEYNNLLLMNNNVEIDESENVEYPFYVLQPKNSTKCVSIENQQLSIKPCSNDNTIRYTGNFVEKKCSA